MRKWTLWRFIGVLCFFAHTVLLWNPVNCFHSHHKNIILKNRDRISKNNNQSLFLYKLSIWGLYYSNTYFLWFAQMDTMGLYGGFMLFCSHDRFLNYLKWLKQKPRKIFFMNFANIFYEIRKYIFMKSTNIFYEFRKYI